LRRKGRKPTTPRTKERGGFTLNLFAPKERTVFAQRRSLLLPWERGEKKGWKRGFDVAEGERREDTYRKKSFALKKGREEGLVRSKERGTLDFPTKEKAYKRKLSRPARGKGTPLLLTERKKGEGLAPQREKVLPYLRGMERKTVRSLP